MNAFRSALLTALVAWQRKPVSPAHRSRDLIVATIGLVAIVVLPAILVYYARKRWRP